MSNLGTLRTRTFTRLAERAGASFSEDEVDVFLNDEYRYLQSVIKTMDEEFFTKRVTFASNSNEKWALPSDFSKMLLFEILIDASRWIPVTKVPIHRLEFFGANPGSFLSIFQNVSGYAYALIDRCIVVKPNPGSSATHNMRLTYMYTLPVLAEDSDTPDPSIDNDYQELLVLGAVNRARQALKEPPIDVGQYNFLLDSLKNTITPRVKKSAEQVRLGRGLY